MMSIEIWQFPRDVTKDKLIRALLELGYVKSDNLFWPGPDGTVSMFWSMPEDFKSTSGVDASVFPLDDKGRKVWNTNSAWALRTRTSIWASTFDQDFQNSTVREVRIRFGGIFYNDHFGKNRYNKIDYTQSTPASRGIFAVLTRIDGELQQLEHALPDEQIKSVYTRSGDITEGHGNQRLLQFSKQFDPSRVIYNALIPFLVAAIESFFRECFEIIIAYDNNAYKKLELQNRKVPFDDVMAINAGEKTLECVISSWYSFQNIGSVNKAYKEIIGIDIWKALNRRKKIITKLPVLINAINEIIGSRHRVIHQFTLDKNLSRDNFLGLLYTTRTVISTVAAEIEKKLNIKLGPG